ALRGERLDLRMGPLPVWMPDLYRRSIEPPIAIVLSIGCAVALPAIAAHLGRFLPRLAPLVATQAALLFCVHPHGIKATSGRAVPQYGHFIPAPNGVI